MLKEHNIEIILIHIDEAHSSDAWPVNLDNAPTSHTCIEDRLKRANNFVKNEKPPYQTFVDNFDNAYAEIYHAWPDKYHMVNSDLVILEHSKYGKIGKENALIKLDCVDLMLQMIQ